MRWKDRLTLRVRSLFRREHVEQELDAELTFHIEQQVEENLAAGMSLEDARSSALRSLGSLAAAKDQCRDSLGLRLVDEVRQDVRYALRTLMARPVFTAVAILTLALGIGANTALFAIVRSVVLSSLAVERPEELVEIGCVSQINSGDACYASYPGFLIYAANQDILSGVFAFAFLPELNALSADGAERIAGLLMSGTAPGILGLSAVQGRWLDRGDDVPNAAAVAVLGHAYWQRRFGGDPGVVGRTIQINSRPVTVVGVSPPSFRGLTLGEVPDVLLPMATADMLRAPASLSSGSWWLRIIGRRKPGISNAQARAALEPLFQTTLQHLMASLPPESAAGFKMMIDGFRFNLSPASAGALSGFRGSLEQPMRILWAIAAIVLLIMCANLAALIVSRTIDRRREFAIRIALGSSRIRLARQVCTESLVLAAIGGAGGLAMAAWIAPACLSLAAGEAGLQAVDLRPDVEVVAFTAAFALLSGLLIGLASMLHATATEPQEAWRHVRAGGRPARVTRVLLGTQVASTLVLIVGAGLFLQTLANFRSVDAGFDKERLVAATVAPALAGYAPQRSAAYIQQAVAAVEALPGVRSATVADLPLATGLVRQTGIGVPGFTPTTLESVITGHTRVGPRFAETLGLSLTRGRDFTDADRQGAARVAIANESFARHFFGAADPLGKEVFFADQTRLTIVGIVRDARDRLVKRPSERWVYTVLAAAPARPLTIMTRADGGIATLVPAVRRTLATTDPAVPVYNVQTLNEQIDSTLRQERFLAHVSAAFGAIALVLVALGFYGVLSGMVARRTSEIGVRMALGARGKDIARLLTAETIAMIGPGIIVGAVGAFAAARFIRSRLFGVEPADPLTAAVAIIGLLLVVVAATWMPLRRATRIEPMDALRYE